MGGWSGPYKYTDLTIKHKARGFMLWRQRHGGKVTHLNTLSHRKEYGRRANPNWDVDRYMRENGGNFSNLGIPNEGEKAKASGDRVRRLLGLI